MQALWEMCQFHTIFVHLSHLTSNVTAPATTGDATLVPERERQPSFNPEPRTPEPYVTMSGFTLP